MNQNIYKVGVGECIMLTKQIKLDISERLTVMIMSYDNDFKIFLDLQENLAC